MIQKLKQPSGLRWTICKELEDVNRQILKERNLSIEDYLAKVFVAPLGVKARAIDKISEELQRIDSLISLLTSKEAKTLARASRDKHEEIIARAEKQERKPESIQAVSNCTASLALLTKALARFLGAETGTKDNLTFLKDFWKDFWFSPGEISEFVNQAEKFKETQLTDRVWYSCTVYRDAYAVLLSLFEDEIDKSRFIMIPIDGLTNDEIKQFHEIRDSWTGHSYFDVADHTTRIVEKKLRSFLFNIFTLLYDDREARLARLDKGTIDYIKQNVKKDQEKGFGLSKNEFEQVNRGNYKNFLIGSYDREIGLRNWTQVFEHTFAPLTEDDVKTFLDMLAEFNIATSHVKEGALGAGQQTKIFSYVLKSIDVVRKMNGAYRSLIEKGLHIVESQGAPRKLFFSFANLDDKRDLTPVFAKDTNAKRIIEQLMNQNQLAIDLEGSQYIESYFSIAYREFMTILARLVMQTPMEARRTRIRVELIDTKGCIVRLRITQK